MKKVMIGILILIPIIILLVVALVSGILSMQAWIGVEDMALYIKGTEKTVEHIELNFDEVAGKNINFYDYIDVKIMPERANRYTVEWQISGDVNCTDSDYEQSYNDYLEHKHLNENDNPSDDVEVVAPAAYLADKNGNEAAVSTSGNFVISSYCVFDVVVQAESVRKFFSVSVVGYDVNRIDLKDVNSNTRSQIKVGESLRLVPNYNPIDSIVSANRWNSDDPSVAKVDPNGVVTAVGEGVAHISMDANKMSDSSHFVRSSDYVVTVTKAASKYGDKIVTSSTQLSVEELGVGEVSDVQGGNFEDGNITITDERAVVHLADGSTLEIERCEQDALAIEHADFYAHNEAGGYALAVGSLALKLNAVWADMLKTDALTSVTWSSSNDNIATVNKNGEVTPKSTGIVTISVTSNSRGVGSTASVDINVQNKITSLRLKTSNDALAVGLARETVFASHKYVLGDDSNNAKTANSVIIHIQGEPENATAEELAMFYSSYRFEIVSGGDYAQFNNAVVNELVFKDALQGKGKQSIVVRVSAKYPRYEGNTRFTVQEVTIKAIYGVEVRTIAQLRKALADQQAYAKDPSRLVAYSELDSITAPNGKVTKVFKHAHSTETFAIVFMDNIEYEKGLKLNEKNNIRLYGDLYGNNYRLSCDTGQIDHRDDDNGVINLSWDNITVSNIVLRANQVPDDAVISDAEDVQSFIGCVVVNKGEDWQRHTFNNRIEFSIIENGQRGINNFNSDMHLDGCIIRNMISIATYFVYRFNTYEDGYVAQYSKAFFNNMVFSNTVATTASFVYERASVMADSSQPKGYSPRFCDTMEENNKFFRENFHDKGYDIGLEQTGFYDIYNWQTTDSIKFIQTGNKQYDDIIGTAAGVLFEGSPSFDGFRVRYNDQWYMHLGFMVSGVTMGLNIMDEPMFLDINLEDKRLEPIKTTDIVYNGQDILGSIGADALHAMPMIFYCYRKDSSLSPASSYVVNLNFIAHLHGEN